MQLLDLDSDLSTFSVDLGGIQAKWCIFSLLFIFMFCELEYLSGYKELEVRLYQNFKLVELFHVSLVQAHNFINSNFPARKKMYFGRLLTSACLTGLALSLKISKVARHS